MELAELLEFLRDWLESDRDTLTASRARFVGSPVYGPDSLRDNFARFRFLLGFTDGEGVFTPDETYGRLQDPSPGQASTISGHAAGEALQLAAREQGITSATAAITGLAAAKLAGSPDKTAALTALTAARLLAAELERSELALINAARDGGATWSLIAAAMGARNRQTAQKRHADLSRRCPRPPSADMPPPALTHPDPRRPEPAVTAALAFPTIQGPAARGEAEPADGVSRNHENPRPEPALAPAAGRRPAVPKITAAVIAEGRYEIVKAPDHAETRAWHVLVGGRRAGLMRPTWRGERSRPDWEAVDNAGTALPATGTGRVTAAGNARTRDAAAVSLLRALQREQESRRRTRPDRRGHEEI